ncbi:MAG: hypothetical protein RR505_09655 [Raoultibacter sp.]
MKAQDAVRHAISESGKTQAGVSKSIGKTRNYVNALVNQADTTGGTLGCETVAGIADACDYALVLLPKGTEPPGSLVIGSSEDSSTE